MRNPSRRSLLVGTACTAITGAIAPHWPAQAQTVYVRQSIAEFSKDPAKVDAYRAGVRRMKSRDVADPIVGANANIARHLALMAETQPQRPALKIPRGRTPRGDIDYLALNFAELDHEVRAWCERLTTTEVRQGDRTLVMVRQGLWW